jgi:acetylornithine deacetylase/succinyl-diaminopimelate desuccinylase-like protein
MICTWELESMLSRKHRLPHWHRAIALTLLALATPMLAASELQAVREACNTITSSELQRHVDVLADDSFEGREAGSRGGQAAGGYLVQYFEQNGLAGAGVDGSYFQPFGNGCRNILGMIRGSDPELQDEVIIIGAHYDHVGYGTRRNSFGPLGYIHNGADDNASGTAALLEVMQAFSKLPEPPRRTVVFAAWDGEELDQLSDDSVGADSAAHQHGHAGTPSQ